jgi:transcription antitermination protein NusB
VTGMTSIPANAKPSHRRKARQLLVQALYQWQMTEANIGVIEAEFFTDNAMAKVDTAYFRELLHGIPARLEELDAVYTAHLDRALSELDPVSLAVLRLGAYELLFRIDVPYKVVINEAINLAKSFGPSDAHKYINSILDKVAMTARKIEVNASRS